MILMEISIVVPTNFSMGVIPSSFNLITFNCYAKSFSAYADKIVVMASVK